MSLIKNIVICGSARFINEIHNLSIMLEEKGYSVTELIDVPYPSTFDINEKLANKEFYFDKIKESDLVLVYSKDGYIGLATAMEIQFSLDDNRHRPVRFLYEPEAIECCALIISTKYNVAIDGRWLS